MREIAALAQEKDLLVLADEIYDRFLYGDLVHLSPASLPGMKERTITLNAVSKMYSMCGWRLGWLVGPRDLMKQVAAVKAAVSGGTPIVSQMGALAALNGPDDSIIAQRQTYIERRKVILEGLDRMGLKYRGIRRVASLSLWTSAAPDCLRWNSCRKYWKKAMC